MNATLWLALAFSFSALAGPGEACKPCHSGIVQAFRNNGMGRSIDLRPDPVSATFYHQRSNRHYRIDGGAMRRHQTDTAGREVNIVEKQIDVGLGSGRSATTYLHRTPQGRWLELPVSWYRRLQGYAMSPGYDRADHMGFRREVSDSCLFCHSAGPEPAPIDCHRCHGSADAHLESPAKSTILNPKTLSPQRQLEICLQCHLETASRGIQDHLLAPDRTVWSFRPGERLSGYKMYFDRADSEASDRFEFNHAGYRLLASSCYRNSGGKLTCTTCHDPHSAKVRADACSQCHPNAHAGEAFIAGQSCASCHMPRRAPIDAIHTSVVDHKIVRRPVFRNPAAEDHKPYTGPVVAFYGEADPLSLAIANMRSGDNVELYKQQLKRHPADVATIAALGKALLRLRRPSDAIPLFERALKLDPMHTESRMHLGVALAVLGRLDASLTQLRRAVKDHPDHSLSWINLGATLAETGQIEEARRAYSEAIRLQPDSQEARHRRALLR
jgi:tetratricopeptide (TPR) repeat protein